MYRSPSNDGISKAISVLLLLGLVLALAAILSFFVASLSGLVESSEQPKVGFSESESEVSVSVTNSVPSSVDYIYVLPGNLPTSGTDTDVQVTPFENGPSDKNKYLYSPQHKLSTDTVSISTAELQDSVKSFSVIIVQNDSASVLDTYTF